MSKSSQVILYQPLHFSHIDYISHIYSHNLMNMSISNSCSLNDLWPWP